MDEHGISVRSGFATSSDGVRLYWRAVGRGPLFVFLNGVGVGADVFWKYMVAHLRDRFTTVVWDYRGHGRSQRDLDPLSTDVRVERHADDLAAVLDAVDPSGAPAVLMGHSMGCQVALEAWRRHPERVRAMVLALGTAGRALETFFDQPLSLPFMRFLHRLAHALGPVSNEVVRPLLLSPVAWIVATRFTLVDPFYTRLEDMRPYLEHLATMDVRFFLSCVLATQDHDAWDLLPDVRVPVLVVGAERDRFTPLWCSRRIAEQVPGAEFLLLADGTHAALIEQPETLALRVDRFLRERVLAGDGAATSPPPPGGGAPPRP